MYLYLFIIYTYHDTMSRNVFCFGRKISATIKKRDPLFVFHSHTFFLGGKIDGNGLSN